MKIFSSFDTNFKQQIIEREQKKYWKKNFLVISHGRFYYFFYIILPTFFISFWAILYLILFFVLAWSIWNDFKSLYYIIWTIVFFLTFLPLWFKVLKKYIDYILDFLIVNPYNIIYYNQEWILNRKWRTIDIEKIKTITVKKEWILRSIFNFWNIVILTEWDEQWTWEINFSFLDDPDNIKNNIFTIINSNKTIKQD